MYNKSLVDQLKVTASQPSEQLRKITNSDFGISDKKLNKTVKDQQKEIGRFQERLYAARKQSLLVVFQAMDASRQR